MRWRATLLGLVLGLGLTGVLAAQEPAQLIVGKWRGVMPAGDNKHTFEWEFAKDGKFSFVHKTTTGGMERVFRQRQGTYKVLEGGRVEIDVKGAKLSWKANV